MTNRLPRLTEKILTIFADENKFYTQTHITKFLKISKQRASYQTKRLIKLGYLTELITSHTKHYKLTSKGRSYSQNFFTRGDDLPNRCHNLVFKSAILKRPVNFVLDNSWRSTKVKHWTKYMKRYDGLTLEVTPSSVIFYLDEFWSRDANQGVYMGFKHVERAINDLCVEFEGLKLGSPKCVSTVIRQHHAKVNDTHAERCRAAGLSIRTPIHEVDSSKGVPELEFVSSRTAQEDSTKYSAFIDKVCTGTYDFESLAQLPKVTGGLQTFVQGGMTLLNMIHANQKMMYDLQKRVDVGVKSFQKTRRRIYEAGQKPLSEYVK